MYINSELVLGRSLFYPSEHLVNRVVKYHLNSHKPRAVEYVRNTKEVADKPGRRVVEGVEEEEVKKVVCASVYPLNVKLSGKWISRL